MWAVRFDPYHAQFDVAAPEEAVFRANAKSRKRSKVRR
jgi:hypothetical protein